ncbi:hypothetical protein CU097_013593 [Rhizopus azygosporus]|uniref:Uncharacterized protein n=1 Tax=Rhizopus azygosporus TaxID=86630 RepID=A0A367K3U9_RHIAZ|nr:hypothetical protein CU097_013593 [Rhizopus azygosporus]
MNYDIDVYSVIQALSHSTSIPILYKSSSITYVRFIPLLLASFLAVVAITISLYLLPNNPKNLVQQRALFRIISIISLITALVVSAPYGITVQSYSVNVRHACSLIEDYTCSNVSCQAETALLGISIGLFVLAAICSLMCACQLKQTRDYTLSEANRVSYYSNQEQPIDEKQQPIDAEKALRKDNHIIPPSLLADDTIWNTENKAKNSLRPPPAFNSTHIGTAKTRSIVQPTYYSSESSFSIHDTTLLPPNLPFAGKRPLSDGSDNTFGAIDRNSDVLADDCPSRSSSCTDHRPDLRRGSSNNTFMYASGSQTQSNHTLGTFNLRQNSSQYSSQDSSTDDFQSISQSGTNKTLQQRINHYLKK